MKKGEKEDRKERKNLATRGATEKTMGKHLDRRFRKAFMPRFIFQGRVSLLAYKNFLSMFSPITSLALSLSAYKCIYKKETYTSSVTVKKGGEWCWLSIMVFLELNLKKIFFS